VGATTIEPGDITTLKVSIHMGRGMGGPHEFQVTVDSSDPAPSGNVVDVKVDFIEP
jgi:hypothetical protein